MIVTAGRRRVREGGRSLVFGWAILYGYLSVASRALVGSSYLLELRVILLRIERVIGIMFMNLYTSYLLRQTSVCFDMY